MLEINHLLEESRGHFPDCRIDYALYQGEHHIVIHKDLGQEWREFPFAIKDWADVDEAIEYIKDKAMEALKGWEDS